MNVTQDLMDKLESARNEINSLKIEKMLDAENILKLIEEIEKLQCKLAETSGHLAFRRQGPKNSNVRLNNVGRAAHRTI